jgi:hypothetical protein
MRWSFRNTKLRVFWGQERIVYKFLFIPKKLDYEWRWLEHVYIKEECKSVSTNPDKFKWVAQDYSTKEVYIQHYNIATGESIVPEVPVTPYKHEQLGTTGFSSSYNNSQRVSDISGASQDIKQYKRIA